jgi:hypothetical protein
LLSPIQLNDDDIERSAKQMFKEDIGLKVDISQSSLKAIPQPDTLANSDHSNNSLDHYFPEKVEPVKPIEIKIEDVTQPVEIQTEKPKSAFNSLFDQIRQKRNDEEQISAPVNPIKSIEVKSEDKPKAKFNSLFEQINARRSDKDVTAKPITTTKPEIIEPTPIVETPSAFSSLFDSIKARRNDKDVTTTPNIANVGLQTPVQDRLPKSPLLHKSSVSNILEDTMNLFDDDPTDIGIDTSAASSSNNIIDNLNNPSIIEPINYFDKIKIDIFNKDHKFKIYFGEMKEQIKNIHIATNDGYLSSFELSDIKDNTLPFDMRGTRSYSSGTQIKEIHVTDLNDNHISIYKAITPPPINISKY